MKITSFFVIYFLVLVIPVFAQNNCDGRYIRMVNKNENFSAPCDKMFILNAETFSRYYYASVRMDSLIVLLPMQQKLSDSLYTLTQEQIKTLNEELKLQQNQIDNRNNAIQRLENVVKICVDNNEDCINKYGKLADKYRKAEKQKKKWRATSGALGTAVVVLMVILIL